MGATLVTFLVTAAIAAVVMYAVCRVIPLVTGAYDPPEGEVGIGAATAAPHHLGDQAEGPLVAAEIIGVKHLVGGQNAHEGDPGEVQPLGDHLRPDEDIVIPPAEGRKELLVLSFRMVVSWSMRRILACGKRSFSASSTFCVPTPEYRIRRLPQWGQAFGTSVL